MSKKRFADLNQIAAMAVRDAIDRAIKSVEQVASFEPPPHKDPAVAEYFQAQRKEHMLAITQLQKMRAEIHQRVFLAYQEEKI